MLSSSHSHSLPPTPTPSLFTLFCYSEFLNIFLRLLFLVLRILIPTHSYLYFFSFSSVSWFFVPLYTVHCVRSSTRIFCNKRSKTNMNLSVRPTTATMLFGPISALRYISLFSSRESSHNSVIHTCLSVFLFLSPVVLTLQNKSILNRT